MLLVFLKRGAVMPVIDNWIFFTVIGFLEDYWIWIKVDNS